DERMAILAGLSSGSGSSKLRRKSALPAFAIGLALCLAACETPDVSTKPGKGVAEVADQTPEEAAANLASLTTVIQRTPPHPVASNPRACASARTGRLQEAIADFTQAIRLEPGNAAVLTNRALAYRQAGRDDLALADFSHAIEADPNHAPAFLGRANLLRAQGR